MTQISEFGQERVASNHLVPHIGIYIDILLPVMRLSAFDTFSEGDN